MATFTWLHLSDFHLRQPFQVSKELLFNQLLKEIEEQCASGLKPDVIFFTGDIAYSGDHKQYEVAMGTFDALLEACGRAGEKSRLFVVPGNHDVDRENVPADLKFLRKQILQNVEDYYEEVDKYLADQEIRGRFFLRFHNYEDFLANYFGASLDRVSNSEQPSYYYTTEMPVEDDKKVVVVGLNSAWMSEEDNEQGRLFVGHLQAHKAFEDAKEKHPDTCLRIVLMHHPVYWLAEEDMARVERVLAGSCSLLLHGHLHCTRLAVHSDPDSSIHVLAAGSSFEYRAKLNAYNIVQLDLDTGEALATLRMQHPQYSANWGHDTITYRHARDGKLQFKVEIL